MNNIFFSKLTKKQVIEAYNSKEYKKCIQMLRGIFTNRNGFLKYLNDDDIDIDVFTLKTLRDILYMWTVIDELKKLLNDDIDILTIAYMKEYDNDYVKEYFTDSEIKEIKRKANKYFIKQKNKLLVSNYNDGNFGYVMDSLKCDYDNYFDYEAKIDVEKGFAYNRVEIAPLREVANIFKHANFNINNSLMYEYALIKYLISIYKYMNDEYIERILLRQKKLGINIDSIFTNKDLLRLFSVEDVTTINKIYVKYVKDGLKVHKGLGLYDKTEYTRKLHTVMNILDLDCPTYEKYRIMKFNYGYTPYIVKESINSSSTQKAIKQEYIDKLNTISKGYSECYEDVVLSKRVDKKEQLGLELGRIITEFLDSNVDIDSYFNQNELLKKEYKRIQGYISKYCPDVYERFVTYRSLRIEKAALMVKKALMNNDSFSEIDYYTITNIPYKEIKKYLQKTDVDASIMFNKFIAANPKLGSLNEKGLRYIYNTSFTFKVVDSVENEKIVEATLDDKKYVISYLKYIGAPITTKNISVGLRRLLNNKLHTENTNLEKRITL